MFIPPGFYVGSLTPVEFTFRRWHIALWGWGEHNSDGRNPNCCAVWSPRLLKMEEPTRGFTEERDCVLDVISASLDQTAANNHMATQVWMRWRKTLDVGLTSKSPVFLSMILFNG